MRSLRDRPDVEQELSQGGTLNINAVGPQGRQWWNLSGALFQKSQPGLNPELHLQKRPDDIGGQRWGKSLT